MHLDHIGEGHYHISDKPDGGTSIMVDPKEYRVLTEQGWEITPHTNPTGVEIDKKNESVLIFYQGRTKPVIVPMPPAIDPSWFTLTDHHLDEVVKQMKEKGTIYDDWEQDYFHGCSTIYGYNEEMKAYTVSLADVIAGSFASEREISLKELKKVIRETAHFLDLKEQGFDLRLP